MTDAPGGTWPPGWGNRTAWHALRFVVGAGLRVAFRMRVENAPQIDGPCVLCPNHTSYLDPLILGTAYRRRIRFLMSAVVYRSPRTNWFFRFNRAVPLSQRSGNREALRVARDTLKAGSVLGIFPEGGISRDGRPLLGQAGAVSLVLAERVPVVPVGILGAFDALPFDGGRLRFPKVTVRFGDPIPPDAFDAAGGGRKERLVAATHRIMAEIAALTGQESRESELGRLRTAP